MVTLLACEQTFGSSISCDITTSASSTLS